ncbi:MAG: hypothetical protein IM557_08220 [Chitinophagaceae bacterium]|nr:hypothetical protein [Chitinophagaceae bacterium]
MPTQHSAITDPNIHEPKGISTASNRQVYKANGSGSGAWTKLSELDFDYSDKANNLFGWNDIHDSLYTSGSPRAISSGTRTQITNNALDAQTDITRLGALWSTVNNNFLINDLNALYLIRVNCKITAAASAGTPYTALFELQSAAGPTVVAGQTVFVKGGSTINQVSFPFVIPMRTDINNQTLTVFITPDTNINIYDVEFVVQRNYRES